MRLMSWVLLIVIVVLDSVWLALIIRMFLRRHKFEVAARSPEVVCLYQVVSLVMANSVLLHWLLLSNDQTLPCAVVQLVSYLSFIGMGLPQMGRTVRLVVVYYPEYRAKYSRFVKRNFMLGAWAVGIVVLSIRKWIFFGSRSVHHSSDARDCFFLDDNLLHVLGVALGGVPAYLLSKKLKGVHDAFRIREEMMQTMGLSSVCVGMTTKIQLCVVFNIVPDIRGVHIVTEILFLVLGLNTGFASLVLPTETYQRWRGRAWKYAILPDEGTFSQRKAIEAADGVVDFARDGGPTAKLFGKFCQSNLCMESWEFIVDAVHYEMGLEAILGSGEEQQYKTFTRISDEYLLSTSANEVNISCAMRSRLAVFRNRDAFMELAEEARLTILKEPLEEIARMLEQNLLPKFRRVFASDIPSSP